MQRLDKSPNFPWVTQQPWANIIYFSVFFSTIRLSSHTLLDITKKNMKQNSQYIVCNETLLPIFLPLSLTRWWLNQPIWKKNFVKLDHIPKNPLKRFQQNLWFATTSYIQLYFTTFPPHEISPKSPPRQIDFASQKCSLASSAERFHLQQQSDPACLGHEGKYPLLPSEIPWPQPFGGHEIQKFQTLFLVGGFTNPSEKYESTWVHLHFPNFRGENSKNVWKHHLDSSY